MLSENGKNASDERETSFKVESQEVLSSGVNKAGTSAN